MRLTVFVVVWLLQIFLMVSSAAAITPPFRTAGRVTHVADGDSFTLRTARGESIDVRLHAIDAPELPQMHGEAARAALMRLIGARNTVRIDCYKRDRVGRSVCRAMVDGRDVELQQLTGGHAWHDTRYADEQTQREQARYAQAQQAARQARRGLWARRPMPPWRCRERQRRGLDCR